MNWYIAQLVFNIQIGEQNRSQFDEQVRLIEAHNEHEAFIKARLLGGREEYEFENSDLHMVYWKFIDVVSLKKIDSFKDGLELCSRILEEEEPQQHIHYLHERAQQMELSYHTPESVSL